MNFLADESVDRQIVDRLRQDGHAVRYVAELEDLFFLTRQEPQPVEGIIFWSLSRLARDQLDSQFMKADLRRRGYVLHLWQSR